ncbi:6966_t:CDS:10 [Ambispora gerdemannii]|uniref:6966_t:CDS:1 n=1 Tax=Ambispora gerdemannii TaxID=144530 RepID=A0A9N9BJG7_9GLOM|nr:6966_t:CDS:10 [Ambispora gerdemannii]
MVRNNSIMQCELPNEPRIHLRIVLPTGELEKVDISLNISRYNFCPNDTLWFYLMEPKKILFAYFDFGDEAPSIKKTYNETGVILSYKGEILSKFHIGEGHPRNETLTMSIREGGGFLRTYIWPNYTITWTKFSLDDQNQIQKIAKGVFYTPQPQDIFVGYFTFVKLDGGYGCAITTNNSVSIPSTNVHINDTAITNSTLNTTTNTTANYYDSDETSWRIFVIFLALDSDRETDLFILYQTSKPWPKLNVGPCRVAYDGTGYGCFLIPYVNDTVPYIYSVRFISEGSVTLINKLRFRDAKDWKLLNFYNVFAGGYIVIGTLSQTKRVGDLYNTSGLVYDTIEIATKRVHMSTYPRNNSLWIGSFDPNKTKEWTVTSINIPKLIQYGKFYERFPNPNINKTIPEPDSTINLRTKDLTIMYNIRVSFGAGNFSIYQYPNLLRQMTPGTSANIKPDPVTGFTKVTINVFNSTFNLPNTMYYVVVDTDFVKRDQNREPLFGIEKNIWHFTTEPKASDVDVHTDTASGLLRLSVNGTNEFKAAYDAQGYSVIKALAKQIAETIPVAVPRISIRNAFQYEPNTQPQQLLLRMDIGQATNNNESDIPRLIEDFRTLLRQSQFTALSQKNYTVWLDSTYNFVPTGDLWDRYKLAIILFSVISVVTTLVYLCAHHNNKEARNIVIFMVVIIIQDFIFDVLFVEEYGHDFSELFLPSVITLVIPIAFNTTVALFVLLSENSREDKFNDWFRKYPQIAAIFTIFSCADVELLTVLSSQVGGLNLFSATFSHRAETVIFWASCVNILIEDLPQFIIRFLYRRKNITYNILPNIALASSAVGLLIAVLGRLYQIAIRCSPRKCQKAVFPVEESDIKENPGINADGYHIVNGLLE